MSVRVMTAVFDRYPAGGGEMLLALALADHANDEGVSIYPSVPRLAQKTRQSERTVQYQMRAMQAAGWLVMVRESRGGRGRASEYRISAEWLNGAEIAPLRPDKEKPSDGINGATVAAPLPDGLRCNPAPLTVQSGALNGATAIAPESSITIKEPSCPGSKPATGVAGPDLILTPPASKPPPQKRGARVADPEVVDTEQREDQRLAEWMFGLILMLHPKHRQPNYAKWADEIRLLRERDKRDRRSIAELFRWANNDPFWRSNILSPAKLREKWDQLVIRRDADAGTGTPGKPPVVKIDSQCAWRQDGAPRCDRPGVSSVGSHPTSPWYCSEHMDLVEEMASTRTRPWRCAEHAEIDVEAAA